MTPRGNFEEGTSVLHIDSTLEKISESYRIPLPELTSLLEQGRRRLFAGREKRVRPGRDEKILTAWNGLMISGFMDGYKVTGDERYLKSGKEAASFVLGEMKRDHQLMRVFSGGKPQIKGYSEDYAFIIQALIDLYEATFDMDWLKEANELNEEMIRQFWDQEHGGFFFSGKENEPLIAQTKSPYDSAIPSANSIAVPNLLKLGYLTNQDRLKEKAGQILRLFYKFLSEHPSGFGQMLSGLSFFLSPEEVGVVGSRNDPRTKSMLREIYQLYLPNKILSFRDPEVPIVPDWIPFLRHVKATEAPATFLCRGFTCLPPVRDAAELRRALA